MRYIKLFEDFHQFKKNIKDISIEEVFNMIDYTGRKFWKL